MDFTREVFLEEVYQELASRTLFDKYDRQSGQQIMQLSDFRERMQRFSWSELYLRIHGLGNDSSKPFSVELAADLELIAFSSQVLDDILDEDNKEFEQSIGRANMMILFTEILLTSLHRLQSFDSKKINQIYVYLLQALQSEWMDVNCSLLDEMDDETYIQNILPKSSAVFKLVAYYADEPNIEFWDEFFTYASLRLQLSNDLAAIYNLKKSDLKKLKPTLPLLKVLDIQDEHTRFKRSHFFLTYALGLEQIKNLHKKIEESGTLEYCRLLQALYQEKCTVMLRERFPGCEAECTDLMRLLDPEAS